MYSRLPEEEPSGSKHLEDIYKFLKYVNLENVYVVGLY
jgi:hypothetical protein